MQMPHSPLFHFRFYGFAFDIFFATGHWPIATEEYGWMLMQYLHFFILDFTGLRLTLLCDWPLANRYVGIWMDEDATPSTFSF